MSEELIKAYWDAGARRDFDALERLCHPEWTAEWPQSGERVRGHANGRSIDENYPGFPDVERTRIASEKEEWAVTPMFSPVRVRGTGDTWIGEAVMTYPDRVTRVVGIFELKEGKVWKETVYWADTFDPPAWRAHLVEPIADDAREQHVHMAPRSSEDHGARRSMIEDYFSAPGTALEPAEGRRLYQSQMREVFHPDAVQDLVQSGERISGLANMLAVVDLHPDFPSSGSLRRITNIGDLYAIEAGLAYEQGAFCEVMLWRYAGDKVVSSTEYYADVIEPPEWRRQWVELL